MRNDTGRFVRKIKDYVAQRVATVPVPNPLMYFGGRLYPDLIIANRVEALTMFDASLRRAIAVELEAICAKLEKYEQDPTGNVRARMARAYESPSFAHASR